MNSAYTSPPQPAAPESPWPGPKMLGLIALILRATLGFTLLSQGLAGYFMRGRVGMTPLGAQPYGLQQIVPVVQICVGLALVLGFGTVIAAVAAALFGLGMNALYLFQFYISLLTVGNTGQFFGNPQFNGDVSLMAGLNTTILALHQVAVIVFGKPAINLYSVDALMFRREDDPRPQAPPPRFVDGRREPDPDDHLIA